MFKISTFLIPIYVTFFWTLVLSVNSNKSKVPKIFLGKLMFLTFLTFLSDLFFYLPLLHIYHYTDSFYILFSLMSFPMSYIYIRLLTIDKVFSYKKHALYFLIPFLIFILYVIGVLLMTEEEHMDFILDIMIYNSPVSKVFIYQKTIYTIYKIVFFSQAIVFIYLSFLLINKNKMKTQNYYANTDNNLRNKILRINATLSITIILAVIFSITDRKAFITNQDWPIITNIILAILIFEVGRLGYSLNSTLPIIFENEEEIDSKRTKLTFDQQRELIHKIELLFENDKIFLNKNLNIWELSKLVGTNRTYISSIINAEYNKNFSLFVNSYRIKHVQMLVKKNPIIGNLTLANSSGFGSVVSMQRAFYLTEGITLKEFREKISSFVEKSDTEKF